jgi:hypothetical protein
MKKDFKPPKQTESHVYVFDRKTGEILATHTRWVDAGAERGTEDISRELLESIAKDSGCSIKDVDVLKAKRLAGQTASRVDVKSRKVTVVRRERNRDLITPEPLRRP